MEEKRTKLLVVDDEPTICDVVYQFFTNKGYTCYKANGVKAALEVLKNHSVDLVLSDIRMPDADGLYLLKEVQNKYPDIALIMMTGVDETIIAVECLKLGAYDYILKPFELQEVNVAVERALERQNLIREREAYKNQLEAKVHERTLELLRAYEEIEKTYHKTLEVLVSALDLRERSTAGHSKRSVAYTRLLALRLNIRGNRLLDITRGALLHDVGKIGVPDTILLKPGPLSNDEWKIMKKHPIYGYRMLKDIKFLEKSLDIVLYHHERWDGKGYPSGLKGEEIPIGARIFAIVDAFDAITSPRVYRGARSFEDARKILQKEADKQFDPRIVQEFLSIPLEQLKRVHQISIIKGKDELIPQKIVG